MRESELKVGTPCVVTKIGEAPKGRLGKIVHINAGSDGQRFLFQSDTPFEGGHDGYGNGKDHHCWWVYASWLSNEKVIPQRKRTEL